MNKVLLAISLLAISSVSWATNNTPQPQPQNQNQGQNQGQGQEQGQLQGQAQGQLSVNKNANVNANVNANANSNKNFSNSNSNSNSNSFASGVGLSNSTSSAKSGDAIAAGGSASSGSSAGGGDAASSQNVSVNTSNPPADLSKSVGVAIAPSVYNSQITCMGGVSASGGFAGGAFAIGTSIESDPCNVRQFAAMVQNDPVLFKAVMCQDSIMKAAYAKVGRSCDAKKEVISQEQAKLNSEARMKVLAEQYARSTTTATKGW